MRESVLLILRVDPHTSNEDIDFKIKEFKHLADSAGYDIKGVVIQKRSPDIRYQIGAGKVEEIKRNVMGVDKVIFYNRLSPTQVYNLTKMFNVETIDRLNLILEIFAKRARSKVAKLQVELATLTYELPRARELTSILKRRERPGFMGLGRYGTSYADDIQRRILKLRRELKTYTKSQKARRKRYRSLGIPRVAICGYTNAGKSTLLNALVGKRCTKSANQLFTTLSPITRSMRIDGRKVMLTDTVGFLEGLPHFMIEAFRSTFSEIYEADVILLVVDASEHHKTIRRKLKTSHSTLFNDWCERPIITVFNKIDKAKCFELEPVRHLAPNPVIVSALNQEGIEDLKTKIGELLPPLETKEIILPMSPESLKKLSTLYKRGIVRELHFDSCIKVIYQTSHEEMKKIKEALDVR